MTDRKVDLVLQEISTNCKQLGVDDYEVLMKDSNSEIYSHDKGKILEQKITQSQVLGVRLFLDGKVGMSYTEALDSESLKAVCKQAMLTLEFSTPNPKQLLAKETVNVIDDNSELNQALDITIEEKLALARELEAKVFSLSDQVKSVPYNGLVFFNARTFIKNSKGVNSELSRKQVRATSSCLLEHEAKQAFDYISYSYPNLNEINPREMAKKVYEESLAMLEAGPLSNGRYDVVFNPETFEELFHTFSVIFSSEAARKELNPLWKQRNSLIASPLLSVYDRPRAAYGLGRVLIDDEGVATTNHTLIENGYFIDGIYNSYTANFFGTKSSGHAKRSPKSSLGVQLHQPEISAGLSSRAELYKGRLLYVTRLDGLHSGANLISGDFSFGVAGYVLEDGAKQFSFKETTVKGNFYQMLKDIMLIGSEIKTSNSGDFFAPEIRFGGLSLAS
jgi:PmbA protein